MAFYGLEEKWVVTKSVFNRRSYLVGFVMVQVFNYTAVCDFNDFPAIVRSIDFIP